MGFKLVSDSSSNVRQLSGVEYANVPMKIITSTAEYVDDASLDVQDMVEQVRQTKGKSGTSCPNIHEWLQAFGEAQNVFAVTITSNLSGSCTAARQAGQEYESEHPGRRVCVLDSLSTGPEMGLILEKLKEWILQELSFDMIREKIQAYMEKTHLLFSLQSLTNLARNGRVNPAVAKLAGVLGIRIVGMASEEGTLQTLHKCRGEKKTLDTLFTEMKRLGFSGGKARISHCLNLESANSLKERILDAFPRSDVRIEPCTALCSFYAEQGGLLVGFEG